MPICKGRCGEMSAKVLCYTVVGRARLVGGGTGRFCLVGLVSVVEGLPGMERDLDDDRRHRALESTRY